MKAHPNQVWSALVGRLWDRRHGNIWRNAPCKKWGETHQKQTVGNTNISFQIIRHSTTESALQCLAEIWNMLAMCQAKELQKQGWKSCMGTWGLSLVITVDNAICKVKLAASGCVVWCLQMCRNRQFAEFLMTCYFKIARFAGSHGCIWDGDGASLHASGFWH